MGGKFEINDLMLYGENFPTSVLHLKMPLQ